MARAARVRARLSQRDEACQPNMLLVLRNPASVRLSGGVRVSYARIGLHLDDPDGFLASLSVSTPEQTWRNS